MSHFRINTLRAAKSSLCLLLLSLLCVGVLQAQEPSAGTTAAQTGTIQGLAQDDGYITISGTPYPFDSETIVIVQGAQVSDSVLDEGMVVRYRLAADGRVAHIEIIGPIDKIRALTNN